MRILVVTGQSGGHIFPALTFLETLKDKYKEVETILILPLSCLKYNVATQQVARFKINYVPIAAIKLRLDFKNLIAILNFFKGSLESLSILLKFHPDMVVGFGSLVSVPLIIFAWALKIKILLHEQNVIPGRANRLLAVFADRLAISFLESRNYLKNRLSKIVFTGNPIRKDFIKVDKSKALDFFGLDADRFTILVMGGSAGSHRINGEFLRSLSLLSDKSNKLQIIHLSGKQDFASLKDNYKDLGIDIKFKLFEFLEPMHYAYNACDLTVSRAGATTIAELIFFNLPAIIIPYPLAYAHQEDNAKILENKNCAIIIRDNELNAPLLAQTLEDLINHPDKIKRMRSGFSDFARLNSGELLVDEALSLVEG